MIVSTRYARLLIKGLVVLDSIWEGLLDIILDDDDSIFNSLSDSSIDGKWDGLSDSKSEDLFDIDSTLMVCLMVHHILVIK